MRTIYLIGIGAGKPEHLTVQAINRLNEVDVFFLLDKGDMKKDLVDARRAILERYVDKPDYRVVQAVDADRDRTPANYEATVSEWHQRRADLYERMFRDELGDDEVGGVLCWGDPTLYDNTIAVIEQCAGVGTYRSTIRWSPGSAAFPRSLRPTG